MHTAWCEIDCAALTDNARTLRRLVGPDVRLAIPVKADAYGHGLELAARAFVDGGADWLCVHGLDEARRLRDACFTCPIYVLGPVRLDELEAVEALDARLVVYNAETIERLAALGVRARLHLKVETGNYRQGVELGEALALAERIAAAPRLELEGVASHFANIEDTTDHRYARLQLARFEEAVRALRDAGHAVPIRHLSNSAATLLWPDRSFDMVRVGVAAYGLWPSKETRVAATLVGRGDVRLRPALHWKTRLMQIKTVPAGALVGYGCTYRTTHPSRIGILPTGYFDGYDRALGNRGHVLVRGRPAPVRGRVCMNITMIDLTDVPDAALEDEVVLLGRQGDAEITADQLGDWADTINYEIVARVAGHLPRLRMTTPPGPIEDTHYRAP